MNEVIWQGPMDFDEPQLVTCRVRRLSGDDCIVEKRIGDSEGSWTWNASNDVEASRVYMIAMLEFHDLLPGERDRHVP